MAQGTVYAELNIPAGSPNCRPPLSSQCLSPPQIPRWHRTALGIANIVLLMAVIILGVWVSQLQSENRQAPAASGNDGVENRDTSTAECSIYVERFRSQLTQSLCHPAEPGPAGGSGCKLCPKDWQLLGDKCYWVSKDSKTWNESCTNCSAMGSQLLLIQDEEELESLKHLTQITSQFWVGLSHSPEKGWTWLDGSQRDPTLFGVPGQPEENSCGVLNGNQISSLTCSSAFQRICQRDAVLL